MTRELTPLEALEKAKMDMDYHRKYECHYYYPKEEREEYFSIIETALKRLDSLDSLNCLIDNSKKLKALEIIKKKKVNFYEIEFTENYEEYAKDFTATNIISIVNRFMLTQEEFNLLKEVLL